MSWKFYYVVCEYIFEVFFIRNVKKQKSCDAFNVDANGVCVKQEVA